MAIVIYRGRNDLCVAKICQVDGVRPGTRYHLGKFVVRLLHPMLDFRRQCIPCRQNETDEMQSEKHVSQTYIKSMSRVPGIRTAITYGFWKLVLHPMSKLRQ